jgi:hypothetical protein
VAASKNIKLKQCDVKTTCLYGELEEEMFLEQPESFDDGIDLCEPRGVYEQDTEKVQQGQAKCVLTPAVIFVNCLTS